MSTAQYACMVVVFWYTLGKSDSVSNSPHPSSALTFCTVFALHCFIQARSASINFMLYCSVQLHVTHCTQVTHTPPVRRPWTSVVLTSSCCRLILSWQRNTQKWEKTSTGTWGRCWQTAWMVRCCSGNASNEVVPSGPLRGRKASVVFNKRPWSKQWKFRLDKSGLIDQQP